MNPASQPNPNQEEIEKAPSQTKAMFDARKALLPVLVGGVLAGVLGTALIMPRLHPSIPVVEVKKEEKPATDGPIKLSEEAVKTAGIRSETVKIAFMNEDLTVPGTVELSPNRSAKVTSPTPGKLMRLLVNPGESVRAGQPLAELDSFEVAQAHAAVRQAESSIRQGRAGVQTAQAETAQTLAGVQQAEGEIAQARTKKASAEIALQRQRDLAKAGAFAQAPLQVAQSELAEAQSTLLQWQTELQSHTATLQRAERLFKEELISRSELEQAQLERLQDEAKVRQAQTKVASAKLTVERESRVFQGDLLTKQAVQTAEAEARAAAGDVLKAKQGLNRAKQDVFRAQKGEQAAKTVLQGEENSFKAAIANLFALEGEGHKEGVGGLVIVFSPINGVVTERTATVGEAVERTTALLVIENLNTVTVSANVAEKDIARIRIGQTALVTVPAYPNQKFPGVIQSIAGRVDEKTRSLSVLCLVENREGRLRPEMFAKVTLSVGTSTKALTAPVSALEEDGANRYVFVQTEAGYERRKVHVGRMTEKAAEIIEGVKPGDKIVVEGVFVLKSEVVKDKLKGDD